MAKAEQECPVYWIMGFSMPASQRGVRGKFLTFLRENPNVLTPALTDNDEEITIQGRDVSAD